MSGERHRGPSWSEVCANILPFFMACRASGNRFQIGLKEFLLVAFWTAEFCASSEGSPFIEGQINRGFGLGHDDGVFM